MTESLNMVIEKKVDGRRLLFHWLVLIAYMGFIFFLSTLQSTKELPDFEFSDKLYHIVEYGILSILLFRAMSVSFSKKTLMALFFYTFLISIAYGVTDEVHQYFVPHRFSTVSDVIADGVGSIVGLYLYNKLWIKRKI